MKRVLRITAKNGGTTAKVTIEVDCRWSEARFASRRHVAHVIVTEVADDVMLALSEASYLNVPLCRQRVGR